MPQRSRIVLVGCGGMGSALMRGWLREGVDASDTVVIEPSRAAATAARTAFGTTVAPSPEGIPEGFAPDVVAFAVKPQSLDEVVPPYRGFAARGAVFLSIAAGKPIAFFESLLGSDAAIVRAMPNLPAAVGRGIAAVCANDAATADRRGLCRHLLQAVGDVVWLDDESLMDAVTAVSGSGPAYVFLLVEALARAGREQGLDPDVAERLALATVAGAGELARQSDAPAAALRESVTSRGGTTAAALEILMAGDGLAALMSRAVAAAARRSRELAG